MESLIPKDFLGLKKCTYLFSGLGRNDCCSLFLIDLGDEIQIVSHFYILSSFFSCLWAGKTFDLYLRCVTNPNWSPN